jgi:putative transposase
MSHPLRIEYAGAWYHVMAQSINRKSIFPADSYRHILFELLYDIYSTFNIEVHAYCLMDNAYHLLISTPQANLSQAMRYLNGVYTQRFNRAEQSEGPLFRGRYKAILIDPESYPLKVSRYIHLRLQEEGLITQACNNKWSSYPYYSKKLPAPTWLNINKMLEIVANNYQQTGYEKFIESGVDEETRNFYSQKRLKPVFGSHTFKKQIYDLHINHDMPSEVPDKKHILYRPTIKDIIKYAAHYYRSSPSDIEKKIRNKEPDDTTRLLLMVLSRDVGGCGLREIAEYFYIGHHRSASVIISRARKRIMNDKCLSSSYMNLRYELLPCNVVNG